MHLIRFTDTVFKNNNNIFSKKHTGIETSSSQNNKSCRFRMMF